MVENICDPELIRVDISGRTEDDPFMLEPGEFCLAETLELFNIPDDISANLYSSQAAHDLVLITCLLAGAIRGRIAANFGAEKRALASSLCLYTQG